MLDGFPNRNHAVSCAELTASCARFHPLFQQVRYTCFRPELFARSVVHASFTRIARMQCNASRICQQIYLHKINSSNRRYVRSLCTLTYLARLGFEVSCCIHGEMVTNSSYKLTRPSPPMSVSLIIGKLSYSFFSSAEER